MVFFVVKGFYNFIYLFFIVIDYVNFMNIRHHCHNWQCQFGTSDQPCWLTEAGRILLFFSILAATMSFIEA